MALFKATTHSIFQEHVEPHVISGQKIQIPTFWSSSPSMELLYIEEWNSSRILLSFAKRIHLFIIVLAAVHFRAHVPSRIRGSMSEGDQKRVGRSLGMKVEVLGREKCAQLRVARSHGTEKSEKCEGQS
eukprot:scaffold100220_cov24-Tisochrysis_lutea.AAC.2